MSISAVSKESHLIIPSPRALGILHPEAISTKQAARYLTEIKGIPTASSTLEVFRCQGRGPKFKRVGSRIFYTTEWLDEYATGVPVRIFDPTIA